MKKGRMGRCESLNIDQTKLGIEQINIRMIVPLIDCYGSARLVEMQREARMILTYLRKPSLVAMD